jgi:prophage regulatory protein
MQFIRAKEVAQLLGVSKVTLWRMVRAGRFPAPVTVNVSSKAYVLEEVEQWMAAAASRRPVRRPRQARPEGRGVDDQLRATGAHLARPNRTGPVQRDGRDVHRGMRRG